MTPEEVRQIIRDELSELLGSDRYIFPKTIQILDGRNIQLGLTEGTKIGIATDQKLSFHGSTPVIQHVPTGASGFTAIGGTNVDSNDVWTGGVGSVVVSIGDIVAALKLKGIIKS